MELNKTDKCTSKNAFNDPITMAECFWNLDGGPLINFETQHIIRTG